MTSFFTTGGIRGGKKKLDKFYPRSFNMGIKADLYAQLGGFSKMRFGEDIDFSIRIFKAEKRCRLFPKAWVWHKRRTDFRKFWRQVYNSGIARVNLYKKYPESLKLVHLLPAAFTIGLSILALTLIAGSIQIPLSPSTGLIITLSALSPVLIYSTLILIDSTIQNRSLRIGALSILAAFTQLLGYGCGFINAWCKRILAGKEEFAAYEKTFYK